MRIRHIPFALVLIFIGASRDAAAQSQDPRDLRTGKVLVATRKLPDPIFAKTVIVLTRYGQDGAMGFILNRQTSTPLGRAIPYVKSSDPVYTGGPVQAPAVYGLLRSPSQPGDGSPVLGDIYMLQEQDLRKTLSADPPSNRFHAYIGYCGWGPGQLENEVGLGAWYIFAGRTDMVFDPEPDSLWNRLVAFTERNIASLTFSLHSTR